MILAVHQPIFLPWPGFFHKAAHCDRLVLLDGVQFPRGRTWLTRNRLKDEDGELWLTVPVWRTGRGVQAVGEVEIAEERGWRAKHLRAIRQNYARAPWLPDHWSALANVYARRQRTLVELNVDLVRWLAAVFCVRTDLVLQTDLGVTGQGTELLVRICAHEGADRLAILPGTGHHLDHDLLRRHGITVVTLGYRPLRYPQLWGDFRENLSALDLLLCCGPRAGAMVSRTSARAAAD
jgi:hypothetical protein